MSGVKHAALPWVIYRMGRSPGVVRGGVFRQYTNGAVQDQLFTIHPVDADNGGEAVQEAHARLVIAAPELLAALQELIAAGDECVSSDDDVAAMLRFGEAHDVARAVIKKATGEAA